MRFLSLTGLLALFTLLIPVSSFAYTTNMSATAVLGQTNFSGTNSNQGGTAAMNTLNGPRGMVICNGKFIVADISNNRVLVWNTVPTETNTPADVVIGQTTASGTTANNGGISAATLNNPFGVACTPGGKLIIADSLNHRVLIYNTVPTSNGASANLILGQTVPTGNTANQGVANLGTYDSCLNQTARSTTLNKPEAVTTDGTRLVVNDGLNQRVLIWNTFPTTTDQPADIVVGQPNFNTVSFNDGCPAYVSCGPNSVGGEPIGATIYGNKLIISNTFAAGGMRLTIWNTFPTSNGQYPDVVVGQSDFLSCNPNQGLSNPTAQTLNQPFGTTVDSSGRLFVADRTNRRILIYNSIPTSNNAPADFVIGQPDFTSATAQTASASTLSGTRMLAVNGNTLYVADGDNNRILIFNNVLPSTNAYGVTPGNISANITWTTDAPTSTQVQYGQTTSYDSSTPETDISARVTYHAVQLTGLKECTVYHYKTYGRDANNNTNSSGDNIFTTTGCPVSGKAPPAPEACNSTSPGNPPELFQINTTRNSAVLHFTPAGEPYTYYMISYGTTPLAEEYGATVSLEHSPGAISFPVNALSPNTRYFFKVRAGNGCMPGAWSNTLKAKTNQSTSYLH